MRFNPPNDKTMKTMLIDTALKIPASCNGCDRIIYEDEMNFDQYNDNGGYCPECIREQEILEPFKINQEVSK